MTTLASYLIDRITYLRSYKMSITDVHDVDRMNDLTLKHGGINELIKLIRFADDDPTLKQLVDEINAENEERKKWIQWLTNERFDELCGK